MLLIYKMPNSAVQQQKRAVRAATLTLFIGVPLLTVAARTLFHFDRTTITTRDVWSIGSMLAMPCMALWLHTNMMKSLRIEMDDNCITGIQNYPFSHSQRRISFPRHAVSQIREGRHKGLYIRGRNGDGRWTDLFIPASLENYDDLRSRLAAWRPIQEAGV